MDICILIHLAADMMTAKPLSPLLGLDLVINIVSPHPTAANLRFAMNPTNTRQSRNSRGNADCGQED
ncbi:MAG: hypothetical protein CMJ19_21820 [Phycisphaeraceae bacterium]|nr:hypothetical protein [Phycisphaeraceae bacterium]